MSDDSSAEPPSAERSTPCPRCGTPVAAVTSVGPHAHYAAPCGCRISAAVLERRR